jgi:segregation and condensation protein B
MTSLPLKTIIESILFVSNKPLTVQKLAASTDTSIEEVTQALEELGRQRAETGIVLLTNGTDYGLATNPENSLQVREFLNSELKEKLSDASLEVFTIIAYKGRITRSEIESIRGVNSQFSIRQLLMRGMIEKHSEENKSIYYTLTTDALAYFGVTKPQDLPNFEKIIASLSTNPEIEKTPSV